MTKPRPQAPISLQMWTMILVPAPIGAVASPVWYSISINASPNDLHHEDPFPLGDANDSLRSGIELEEVLFDAIAENDTIFRHLRFELQWCFRCYPAKHQRSARCMGREWLPNRFYLF